MFLAILAAMGSITVVMTRAEIKTGDNYKNTEQAFFLAQAGAEHAREQLRAANAVSANTGSFTDELGNSAGLNGLLDGYVAGTDDAPIINSGSLTEGSMVRAGGGTNTIRGGIFVANTVGLDGIMYTGDDALGPPNFNTAGGGVSNIHYCSTVMEQALRDVPPRTIAFNHLM